MARKRIASDDAVLARAKRVLSDPSLAGAELAVEYEALAGQYRSLLHKLEKTLTITDGYQSQLQELNASLSRRVEKETERRLSHERMLLQHQKLAAMGEMISAIAHQWRQPLSIVAAIVQGVRDAHGLGKLEPGYLEQASADALSQIRHMNETIGAFRTFFHPDKGTESFSVFSGVKDAASLMQSQLSASGIALELTGPEGDDTITSYPNEFIQVILNLIANGRDAILKRRGTGEWAGRGRITVRVSGAPERIGVEVADNGCGIPDEVARRIFEPYFTTKVEGGTGIGLYMSRLIVEESMGGRISFASGKGRTVFSIELPGGKQG